MIKRANFLISKAEPVRVKERTAECPERSSPQTGGREEVGDSEDSGSFGATGGH